MGPTDTPRTAKIVYICPTCQTTFDQGLERCPEDGTPLQPLERTLLNEGGRVIAERFHVESVIGEGGMGTVYRAIQQPIGRPVAVKVLHAELARDTTYVSRFLNEAQSASVLQNPHSVTIYDFGQTPEGSLYIAMELLDGLTLAQRVAQGPLSVQHAVEISLQVCRALSEAHRKGIVHRDLKPDNVMLTAADDGALVVKVVDFGIAKVIRHRGALAGAGPVTQVGVVMGTPRYMSPEQAQGVPLTASSDLYSLGVILFEMISGRPPFEHPQPVKVAAMHIHDEPPELTSPSERPPEALAELVASLLSKSPLDRPGSADEVSAALRAFGGWSVAAVEVYESGRGVPRPRDTPVETALDDEADTDEEQVGAIADERPTSPDMVPPEMTPPSVEAGMGVGTEAAPARRRGGARKGGLRLTWVLLAVAVVVFAGGVTGIGAYWASYEPSPGEAERTLPPEPPPQGGVVVPPERDAQVVEGGGDGSPRPEGGRLEKTSLVSFVSDPSDAQVFNGAERVCTTPCTAKLPTGRKLLVTFKREGYLLRARRIIPGREAEVKVELRPSALGHR